MNNAILYARVSTIDQAVNGVSLSAQVERMSSYSAAMGLHVVSVIRDEGVSAGKPLGTRPGGIRLLNMLKDNQANHIVALKLDRLFRNTEDALHLVTQWDSHNIALHLCDLGGMNVNTRSSMGKILMTLLAAFAEFERTLIAERTAAALAHKKRNRQAYNHEPYGFIREGKQLIPHEAEQKVLKHIFAWRKEDMSLYRIAERLNDLGVPAKKGGVWHAATISHVLNNDLYHEPDNLIPYEKKGESAEGKFIGQLTGVVQELGDDKNIL